MISSGPLTYYVFDPSQLRIGVIPYGTNQSVPVAPADVLSTFQGSLAAVNGPFFDTANGDSEDYATTPYETILTRHFDAGYGVDFAGSHPNDGATISVVGGQAQMLPGSTVAVGANAAVQGWPTLVSGGSNVASNDASSDRRAALAILSNGVLAIVASTSLTLRDFADALLGIGATDAINLDGGGSTALVPGSTGTRRVASWLVVMPPKTSGFGFVLLGAALISAWWLWRNR